MEEITAQKLGFSAVAGVIFSWIGGVWQPIVFVFAATVLDLITGILAGRANEGIISKKCGKGIYKKMGFMCLLCMGLFLDIVFKYCMIQGFNVQLPFNMPIGLICAIWIVTTETISVCENLERLGIQIPSQIMWLLRKTQKQIDNKKKEDDSQ